MFRIGDLELKQLELSINSKQLFRVGNVANGHWQQVNTFERELAQLTGAKHALLVSGGGTAALTCALIGQGIGPGDEVIVPAYTFMATASAVLMAGAIPVLADVDESLGLDPVDFERRISKHTKAVMPVHILGRPADMDRIMEIAKRRGVKVIEDACQMDGGSYKGRRVASIGDAGAFSFNDFKIISCGEGGAMLTNDDLAYERASIFHDSGAAFRPYAKDFTIPVFLGQQFRASEVMGAILRGQLRRLEGILRDLRRNAKRLRDAVSGAKNIKLATMNDPEGDCGVCTAFTFPDEASAVKFKAAPGVGGYCPIDTGKHVFVNWGPLRERNVYHHPRMNPFNFEENKGLRADYGDEVCKTSLDICKRTVIIGTGIDWKDDEIDAKAAACAKAAASL